MLNQRGQSLLEIATLLGAIVAIVAGLTYAVVNGLKNSQFSTNQAQATKLAQDGIEKVRTIRSRDGNVCTLAPLSTKKWSDLKPLPSNVPLGIRNDGSNSCYHTATNCGFMFSAAISDAGICNLPLSSLSAIRLVPTSTTGEAIPGTAFSRRIYLEDYKNAAGAIEPERKKVTSEVTWSDASGTHKSELVTILNILP